MKKKLILILALFFLLLIFFNKTIIQLAFERKLSKWTEYNTELVLSKFGLFSGQIKIQDIRLKNKLNFFNQNLFEASQIIIEIDSNTYFNELVVIKSVELKDPKFFFEIKNIKHKELKDNLNLIDKLLKKQKPKIYPPKKKDKNFVINNLNITDAKAFIKYEKYDQNVVVPLSDMSFSKVGNSGHFDPEYQHYKNVMKIILNDIFFRIPDKNLRKLIQEKYLKK